MNAAGGRSAESAPARLVAFTAFAAAASIQWASMLLDPPVWRFALAVIIAVGAALALIALARRSRGPHIAATAAIGLAAAAGGLVAVGIPAVQLLPWNWSELGVSIDGAFDGLAGSLDYPIADPGGMSTALLVSALPIMLALAAVLGFRPGRDGPGIGAPAILLACFAIPATARPATAVALWGGLLLALVCVWLWAPRIRATSTVVMLVCAGLLATPVATTLARGDAPIGYSDWTLSEAREGVNFGWDHGYGPIDWPRTGTPLFEVSAEGPRYWRTTVLDEFYAFGWRRSASGGPATDNVVGERWLTEASFSISGLESSLLVSPGVALQVDGVDGVEPSEDGTLRSDQDPLEEGDSYSVLAYAPDPDAQRMRAASQEYPPSLEPYSLISIPYVPAPLGTSQAIEPLTPAAYQVPLWGSEGSARPAAQAIADSPYGTTAELARRLTANRASAYDAVIAVQRYLRGNYEYDETPPARTLPIPSFLFRDRSGYCQHFSGAMALILRMSGIPARVASGFAPGTPVSGEEGRWEVTDLEAHSWVEVYFNRIGWVPFDPTPAAAPAGSQSDGGGTGSAALGGIGPGSEKDLEGGFGGGEGLGDESATDGGGVPWGSGLMLLGLLVLALFSITSAVRALRYRRLSPAAAAEAELAELAPALRASGRTTTTPLTLLELERRLRDGGRIAAADYVRGLREARYAAGEAASPSPAERRATRRDLAERVGLLRRARLLIAMPPGGPRRARGLARFGTPTGEGA